MLVPFGAQKSNRSKGAKVAAMPPAKVVTPPPWTPMLPVIACKVNSACMCKSPWYQCESPKPTLTARGLLVPQTLPRATTCEAGTSVSFEVYSGVYFAAMSASAWRAVRALRPATECVPRTAALFNEGSLAALTLWSDSSKTT